MGDRNAHEAGLHLAQLAYFLGFVAFFAFPWIFTLVNLKKFISELYKHPVKIAVIGLFLITAVQVFSYVHPYLLADNRHYTFYLWRRFLGRNTISRLICIPVYVYTGITMLHLLQRKDALWKLLFCICTAISLVPQRLLEFRYFIPAFVIWRLNISPNNSTALSIEFALYTLVNAFTIYMFLFYTFKWPNSAELQRIMW